MTAICLNLYIQMLCKKTNHDLEGKMHSATCICAGRRDEFALKLTQALDCSWSHVHPKLACTQHHFCLSSDHWERQCSS